MKTIFVTIAYNAEATIKRTVESVLAQSHREFVYYIADNGSTDRTGAIIKDYARTDSRIRVISKQENNIWLFFEILPEILARHDKTDYLCSIDADDTYNHDFLEKMLAFVEKERLDIAACGNDFVDAATGKIGGARRIGEDLLLAGRGFAELLPRYHQFMRTVWGKIYSLAVLAADTFEPRYEMGYGGDTVFTIEAFRRADRVGILSESLHKYYVSQKSASYQFNEKRIVSDRILVDVARDFLISKAGGVNEDNEIFLLSVYLCSVVDTLNVLINAPMTVEDKFAKLLDILQSRHTQELMACDSMAEQNKQLFGQVANWLGGQKGADLHTTAAVFSRLGAYIGEKRIWRADERFTQLLIARAEADAPTDTDARMAALVSENPLLAGADMGFLQVFAEIVFFILQEDNAKALGRMKELLDQETDIPAAFVESFVTLGLNAAAKLEQTDHFVYFKKLQISLLIQMDRSKVAEDELDDWERILPDDTDFKALRAKLR